MTPALVFDGLLALLAVAAAMAAIGGRDLFGSVAFFIVYGLLIAIAWVRLDAIDVALAEAAIGAGLTGILLISALARVERTASSGESGEGGRLAKIAAALLCAGVAGALAWAALALDPQGAGLTPLISEALPQAGVGNPVTAVLLNFRAYDTLLESIVLLFALVAVWSLADDGNWGGLPGLRQHARSDGVLATFGRLLPPFGLVVAVYLVWAGSENPGGAFQGGTVLAAIWLLVAMAGITELPRVSSLPLRAALVFGPAFFLAVGAIGALAGTFLGLAPAAAKAIILAVEAGLTLSIAATLALLVAGSPQRTQG
ncbi:MAG: DUF4040 domain-containing protein [Salinarimonadaceae bacterium]|nr:MAG: DUF4040 domain-containing protein [Salinarimonadaceae bacterium]